MTIIKDDEFSVAVFYSDGTNQYIERYITVERAWHIFKVCCKFCNPEVTRVIITDGWDRTNAEWKNSKDLSFPTREDLAKPHKTRLH
jgi:hypothetical protein